jgi:hypothetical protein
MPSSIGVGDGVWEQDSPLPLWELALESGRGLPHSKTQAKQYAFLQP